MGLSQKMLWLLENPQKTYEFGKNGRELIEAQYSEESYFKQLMDLFTQVISS